MSPQIFLSVWIVDFSMIFSFKETSQFTWGGQRVKHCWDLSAWSLFFSAEHFYSPIIFFYFSLYLLRDVSVLSVGNQGGFFRDCVGSFQILETLTEETF